MVLVILDPLESLSSKPHNNPKVYIYIYGLLEMGWFFFFILFRAWVDTNPLTRKNLNPCAVTFLLPSDFLFFFLLRRPPFPSTLPPHATAMEGRCSADTATHVAVCPRSRQPRKGCLYRLQEETAGSGLSSNGNGADLLYAAKTRST
jgi:hypothetical protein